MSDFSIIPYTPPVADANPSQATLTLSTPSSCELPVSQIQNVAFPEVFRSPSPPVFQQASTKITSPEEYPILPFSAESPNISSMWQQNLAAVQDVTTPGSSFSIQQAMDKDIYCIASSSSGYHAPVSKAGSYLPSSQRIAEREINKMDDESACSSSSQHRPLSARRGPPGSRTADIRDITSPAVQQKNTRKRTARTAKMDKDLNPVVRHWERMTTSSPLTRKIECFDSKTRLNAFKSLRSNVHLTHDDQPSSSVLLSKACEIVDDLIEFTEMITQADRFFYALCGREVTEILAANNRHPRYEIPVIQYLVATQEPSVLLERAIGKLRNYYDQAVWINTEGTNISRQQLEAYGFRDAGEEDFMELRQRFINPARDAVEGELPPLN